MYVPNIAWDRLKLKKIFVAYLKIKLTGVPVYPAFLFGKSGNSISRTSCLQVF